MVFFLQGKVKCMNRRSVKIMRRKAGGTAGKNAEKYSVNLPAVWLHAMGLSKEDRVELSFDGEKISIQPLASTDPEVFRRNAEQKGHRLKEYRYYDGNVLCTVILADFTAQQVCVENKIDDVLDTAFGVSNSRKNKFFFSHIIFLSLISSELTHFFLYSMIKFIIFQSPVGCY